MLCKHSMSFDWCCFCCCCCSSGRVPLQFWLLLYVSLLISIYFLWINCRLRLDMPILQILTCFLQCNYFYLPRTLTNFVEHLFECFAITRNCTLHHRHNPTQTQFCFYFDFVCWVQCENESLKQRNENVTFLRWFFRWRMARRCGW